MTATAGEPLPRKRRRARPYVIAAVVLVVLIVGFFVADALAKTYAEQRIRTRVVSALGLSSTADVTVDLGPGSILVQALSGTVDTLDVSVPRLAFGQLVGDAHIHATRVPLDTTKPLDTLSVTYSATQKDLSALAKNLTGATVTSVTLKAPDIIGSGSLPVFGVDVPVTVGILPSVAAGELVFATSTIGVAGQTFTSESLKASPLFGGLADVVLKQQAFCIAKHLPRGLTATSAKVSGSHLVIGFRGDGTALGGPDFTSKGTCS